MGQRSSRLTGRSRLMAMAEMAGIRRVDVVAWRDLDDAEAGGSELHAHEVLRRWADAGHRCPRMDFAGRWGGPGDQP